MFNGDLDVVSGIDMEKGELSATSNGREVVYGVGQWDELTLT